MSDNLPELPKPYATEVIWHQTRDEMAWSDWYHADDKVPTDWDSTAPDEVVHVYTADEMRAYARAALASRPEPEHVSVHQAKQPSSNPEAVDEATAHNNWVTAAEAQIDAGIDAAIASMEPKP